jgi:hypothetical protein
MMQMSTSGSVSLGFVALSASNSMMAPSNEDAHRLYVYRSVRQQ